jgi:NAD(P)H-flavin reductase
LRSISLAVAANNPTNFQFEAGQYLGVMHPNGTLIPLSIASAPTHLPVLELLYRSDLTSDTALAFDDLLRNSTSLQVDGPFGNVTLRQVNPTQGLRIVASGTGIAQALGLVDALATAIKPISTEVLWATQIETPSSNRILAQQPWLQVTRCSSSALPAELATSVNQGANKAAEVKTVIAGPPDFVYQVCDTLLGVGVNQDSLAADAFAYAPR